MLLLFGIMTFDSRDTFTIMNIIYDVRTFIIHHIHQI